MKQEYILLIETSTEACSAALSKGEEIIMERYTEVPKSHASVIGTFIKEILEQSCISPEELCAVAVSKGPGSYTGLRVGVSCAKGLCYGAEIPLIGVNTLEVIAQCAIDNGLGADVSHIVPMIDARRMEVYTATYSPNCRETARTRAMVLEPDSFRSELERGKVLFTGSGAEKYRDLIPQQLRNNALFAPQMPHASGLRKSAFERLQKKKFEDCAYFEPFYLKNFVAGKPKKLL